MASIEHFFKITEENREFLQTIIDNSSELIFCLTENQKCCNINAAACMKLGYSIEEAANLTLRNLDPTISAEFWQQMMEKARTEQHLIIERNLYSKNGKSFPVELRMQFHDFKNEAFFLLYARDISQTKDAMKSIIDNELLFRTLIDNSASGILIYQGLKLKFSNKAAEIITGYDSEEIHNMDFFNIIHPESWQLFMDRSADLMNDSNILTGFEIQIVTKQEEFKWIDIRGSNISYQGKAGVMFSFFDITDKKNAEQLLLDSLQENKAILNTIPDVIFKVDAHGMVAEAKLREWVAFLKPTEYLIGSCLYDYIPKWLAAVYADNIELVKKSREIRAFEYKLEVAGRIKYREGRIAKIDENSFLIIVRDITDRKEAESNILSIIIDTEEKERDRFAKDLHDDLGPTLASLKLLLKVVEETSNPEELKSILMKGYDLINSAISTTKEISVNLSPHLLNNFGLIPAIRSFCNNVEHGKVKIAIQTNIENERIPKNFEVSLYRIFVELIVNSLKHANANNVEIQINKVEKQLRCYYADDGNGFDPQIKLFAKSTGMGLLNIMNRIEHLNGKHALNAEVGKGMALKFDFDLSFESK